MSGSSMPEIQVNNSSIFHAKGVVRRIRPRIDEKFSSTIAGGAHTSQLSMPATATHLSFLAETTEDSLGVPSPPSSRRGSSLQRRKFSIPVSMSGHLLGIESSSMGNARRRLSNVSDVVTRKLSNTIGWRQVPSQEIVEIGRSLCSQYIRGRLKRSGYLNKKCGLQRLRSAVNLPGGTVFREVFPEFLGIGLELERMYPKLYCNVARQASPTPGGRLTSDKEVATVLTSVARELFKQEITWCKVVSLYAVAGGLAVDCARQGHYDYLIALVEAMEEILEDELSPWIQEKGGWGSLSLLLKTPQNGWWPWQHACLLVSVIAAVTIVTAVILRLIGI